ncbi:glycosyltransferase family 2 protein [Paenibacillus sp. FSL R5-0407]|uniref:glycosyltransferase family 2 protein n=1 Tax=Paenibacillus sp. FSL R5-0407 TaxID=2975320 RepID=UPI0030FBD979
MRYPRVSGLVSVVVTNYNKADYIEECLNSIAKQTYKPWELIIIDDHSTDHSRERIERWLKGRSYPPACSALFIPLPRNVGFSGALSHGYFMSRGEYIAVQDSDDWSHPDRLHKQVEHLKANPHIDLVGSNYTAFKVDAEGNLQYTEPKWLKYGEHIMTSYNKGRHCICHGTLLFRGQLFDSMGGPTRKMDGAEDYEFIAKSLANQAKIDNLRDVLYYYRLHPDQRSREFYSRKGGK